MTLIIGIKCSDGLVLGADSGATLGSTVTGLRTIIQPVTKLEQIANKAIVGVSGPVGLGQLYANSVYKLHNSFRDSDGAEVCRKLRDEFRKDAEIALRMAAMAIQVLGSQAQAGALTTTLVALAANDGPQLIQFDCECSPEMATNDLPFVSIGSGQIIADPFLAFLKRIFWEKRPPSVSEGIFAVVWTLEHTIKTAWAGIAGPIRVGRLRMQGTQAEAQILTEPELVEHRINVTEIEKYIQKFPQEQRPTAEEPEPPQPPPSVS